MPGICGFVDRYRTIDASSIIDTMIDRVRIGANCAARSFVDASVGVALAKVTLKHLDPAPAVFRYDDGDVTVVLDGELSDVARVVREIRSAGHDAEMSSDVEIVARALRLWGKEGLLRLKGSFVAAIWDAAHRRLTLVNDRLGTRILYYAMSKDRLVFASSVKAVLVDSSVSRRPSVRGITQFFSFGQYLSNDTSLEAVNVLPAAALVTYDANTGAFECDHYWHPADVPAEQTHGEQERLERIEQAFQAAVDACVEGTGHIGLALSGGLDARTILGAIDHDKRQITSICYSSPNSLDHRCSQQMVEAVGGSYHHYQLGTEFLADFERHLSHTVQLTDGQYLSQCIVSPTLPLYRSLGIDVLLRGHAGELMHMQKAYAYSLDREALEVKSDAALEEWLFRHLQGFMLDTVSRPLLSSDYQEALDTLPRESLHECLEMCGSADPPSQRVWRLFLMQRLRRETALSMQKFRSVVEVRLPYLDNDLIDLLLAAPPEVKMSDTIQQYILSKQSPALLNIVNANTGARIGASGISKKMNMLKLRALAKLGVPGYQPYERLGLWLRRELAPLVRRVLLSDQCLERGIFDPAGVRSVVKHHTTGGRNCTYLLMAMMIFELGQRFLLDEQGIEPLNVPTGDDVSVAITSS